MSEQGERFKAWVESRRPLQNPPLKAAFAKLAETNPELAARVQSAPVTGDGFTQTTTQLTEEPSTLEGYSRRLHLRIHSLGRWLNGSQRLNGNKEIAVNGPVIRELLARAEGDLQTIRTMVKDIEKAAKK